MRLRHIAALATLLLPARPSGAEPLEHFDLDLLTWRASDVVLVDEGEQLDGEVLIREVWKGTLTAGTAHHFDELADFAPQTRREIFFMESLSGSAPEGWEGPTHVDGSRLVLFLLRSGDTLEPASHHRGFETAAAWLAGDAAYGFGQFMIPGPNLLRKVAWDWEVESRVRELTRLQTELERARRIEDPHRRAVAVWPLTREFAARAEAFEALGESGEAALPMLLSILREPFPTRPTRLAAQAVVKAGGSLAVPPLIEILEADLAFWQMRVPKLDPEWWNDTEGLGLSLGPLRERYGRLLDVLHALEQIADTRARTIVTAHHDFWNDLPPGWEEYQIVEYCDRALSAVSQETSQGP